MRRYIAALLDDIADHVVLVDVAPEMDAHCLFAIEEGVGYAADLAEDDLGNGPCVGVLLQGADVEADGLLDDVVLAVGDEEGPVGQVDDGRHDDDAGEEGCVMEELGGQAYEGGDVFGGGEAFGCMDFPGLRGEEDLSRLDADVDALYSAEA